MPETFELNTKTSPAGLSEILSSPKWDRQIDDPETSSPQLCPLPAQRRNKKHCLEELQFVQHSNKLRVICRITLICLFGGQKDEG